MWTSYNLYMHCKGTRNHIHVKIHNAVVIVGFTEKFYEMVAGQIKEVCVLAEGELEKTVSLNMEQHGTHISVLHACVYSLIYLCSLV